MRPGPELFERLRVRLLCCRDDSSRDVSLETGDDLAEQRDLGPVVVVDRSSRDPGVPGDVIDGDFTHPMTPTECPKSHFAPG